MLTHSLRLLLSFSSSLSPSLQRAATSLIVGVSVTSSTRRIICMSWQKALPSAFFFSTSVPRCVRAAPLHLASDDLEPPPLLSLIPSPPSPFHPHLSSSQTLLLLSLLHPLGSVFRPILLSGLLPHPLPPPVSFASQFILESK